MSGPSIFGGDVVGRSVDDLNGTATGALKGEPQDFAHRFDRTSSPYVEPAPSSPPVEYPLQTLDDFVASEDSASEPTDGGDSSVERLTIAERDARDARLKRTTHLYRIRHERRLHNALQQQEFDDLSLHLYNAHAIKANAQQGSLRGRFPDRAFSRLSKRRWLERDVWVPGQSWTAWPLEPQHVPAEGETWNGDPENELERLVRTQRDKLSDELEECVTNSSAKKSRISFALYKDGLARQRLSTDSRTQASTEEGHDFNHTDAAAAHISSMSHETPHAHANAAQNVSLPFSDTSIEDSGTNRSSHGDAMTSVAVAGIAPIADDEAVSRLVEPFSRGVLSQVDSLLIALHRNRQNQRTRERSTSSGGSDSSLRYRSTSRSSGSQTGLQEQVRSPDSELHGSTASRSRRSPEPRDWSDLLGAASLLGWDTEALNAAARRCSALFHEQMSFSEVPPRSKRRYSDYLRPSTTSRAVDGEDEQAPQEVLSLARAGSKRHGNRIYCPVEGCSVLEPFETRALLETHLKKDHSHGNAAGDKTLKEIREQRGLYVCPESGCPRSFVANAFSRRDRWIQHIKKQHGYEYKGREMEVSVVQDDTQEPEERPEFCCPDADCERHTNPFPKLWQLNSHIKRVHRNLATVPRVIKVKSYPCPDPDCERHEQGFPQKWRLKDHIRRRHVRLHHLLPQYESGYSSAGQTRHTVRDSQSGGNSADEPDE